TAHPNPTGQNMIASGIRAQIAKYGWFSNYANVTQAAPKFTYIPGQYDRDFGLATMADASGRYTDAQVNGDKTLVSCTTGVHTIRGWIPVPGGSSRAVFNPSGPDSMTITCAYPRPGDVVEGI